MQELSLIDVSRARGSGKCREKLLVVSGRLSVGENIDSQFARQSFEVLLRNISLRASLIFHFYPFRLTSHRNVYLQSTVPFRLTTDN